MWGSHCAGFAYFRFHSNRTRQGSRTRLAGYILVCTAHDCTATILNNIRLQGTTQHCRHHQNNNSNNKIVALLLRHDDDEMYRMLYGGSMCGEGNW